MAAITRLTPTNTQSIELTEIAQSRSLPAGYVFRAKLILMLSEGRSYNDIKQRLQTTAPTISRWNASSPKALMDWTRIILASRPRY